MKLPEEFEKWRDDLIKRAGPGDATTADWAFRETIRMLCESGPELAVGFDIECCANCEWPKIHKGNKGWTECQNPDCPSFAQPMASACYRKYILMETFEKSRARETALRGGQVIEKSAYDALLEQAKILRKVAVVSDRRDQFDKFLEELGNG